MSTLYGFRCRSHEPALSAPVRLRLYAAEALLARRAEVPTLLAWSNDLLVTFGGGNGVNHDAGAAIYWLAEHPGCDVAIEDEYGGLHE